jgi:SpoVK/Ycf46/Vps4 family AAA+-type ATPase
MEERIKPGYRVLFYGPPGTGKTLAATLLGKYTGKDVYKIDLSMVVSKFIGETEKNLANLFANAENHDWILFFDEADALFGKRTNVRDAHDKYANQEVSYLLQRVETYKGLVILASNYKDNIDEAFVRRFQSIVYFPMPKKEERFRIWTNTFPSQVRFEQELDLMQIADQYELTGANIVNVVQQVCLESLAKQDPVISTRQLIRGISKEFAKEGKML